MESVSSMSTSQESDQATANSQTNSQPIIPWLSADVVLSLATLPLILGLLGAKNAYQALQSLGQASEEIFRGDRLPLLHHPESSCDDP